MVAKKWPAGLDQSRIVDEMALTWTTPTQWLEGLAKWREAGVGPVQHQPMS